MPDDPNDEVARIAKALVHQAAAQPNLLFTIGARSEREADACRQVLNHIGQPNLTIVLRDNPDCGFYFAGERIGFEATEFTDESRNMRRNPNEVTLWTDAEMRRHLQAIMDKKASKIWTPAGAFWGQRWLGVTCNEAHCHAGRWKSLFKSADFDRHWFDRAFVITYDLTRSAYATFEVP